MNEYEALRAAFARLQVKGTLSGALVAAGGVVVAQVSDEAGNVHAFVPLEVQSHGDFAEFVVRAHRNMGALLDAVSLLQHLHTVLDDVRAGYREGDLHMPVEQLNAQVTNVISRLKAPAYSETVQATAPGNTGQAQQRCASLGFFDPRSGGYCAIPIERVRQGSVVQATTVFSSEKVPVDTFGHVVSFARNCTGELILNVHFDNAPDPVAVHPANLVFHGA